MRAEAGVILEKLDEQTIHAVGGEMRFHPSTYRMASLGGFIAGGSGGVGSIRWGGLRDFGNLLGLKVITCEAEPRVLDLIGPDILKVAHAYGTNGIIVEAEIPLTAHYDWVDVMVGFDSIIDACAFAEQLARQDGLLCKEISPVAAPVAHDYFNRHRPYIRSPRAVGGAASWRRRPRCRRSPTSSPSTRATCSIAPTSRRRRRRRSCRRSTSWRGTTRRCAGSRSIRASPTSRRSIPTSTTSRRSSTSSATRCRCTSR